MAGKSKKSGRGGSSSQVIARNRKARYLYEVLETLEAGISLRGPEVKSLREGKASLGDAYAAIRRGRVTLEKLHISAYEPATRANSEPLRSRPLLLHRSEIAKLESRVVERGLTLVPLSLYFNDDGRAKVELALVRGKKLYDKRETMKRKDADRDAQRAMRARRGR